MSHRNIHDTSHNRFCHNLLLIDLQFIVVNKLQVSVTTGYVKTGCDERGALHHLAMLMAASLVRCLVTALAHHLAMLMAMSLTSRVRCLVTEWCADGGSRR